MAGLDCISARALKLTHNPAARSAGRPLPVSKVFMRSATLSSARALWALLAAAQLPPGARAPNGSTPQVSVYVMSADAMNGVTHPRSDQQEIVDALREEIGKHAALRLVTAGDKPAVTVIVVSRRSSPRPPSLTRRSVAVRLLYLDADANMTALSDQETDVGPSAWNKVTVKLAEQLDAWIAANRQILIAK